jgi:hypothetical protein
MSDDLEEWRDLPDWPGYQVSSLGQMRSNKKPGPRSDPAPWKIIHGGFDKDGYRKFTLKRSTVQPFQHCIRMCSTVATIFHGPRPPGFVATHLNGNNQDDRACNLAWRSQADNIADKVEHGTNQTGSRSSARKLGEIEVLDIKRRLARDESQSGLAREYGVRQSCIWGIHRNVTWAFLDPGTYNVYPETRPTRRKNKEESCKMISTIHWLHVQGFSSRDISIIMDCTKLTVNRKIAALKTRETVE